MHTKKIECLGFQNGTAREKAQVIWELRHEHKIGLLIDVADIPRSTYYYYSKQFSSPNADKYTVTAVFISTHASAREATGKSPDEDSLDS